MARSYLDDHRFRLQFAGHETFPLRYGWLKKSFDAVMAESASPSTERRSIFTDEAAIAHFGVGKNMVAAMRHWSMAVNILHAKTDDDVFSAPNLRPTKLGEMLFASEGDPYLERPISLWLLHWHLVSLPGRATTWYWAFNEFNETVFTRDMMKARLARRCDELKEAGRLKSSRITDATLKGDVLCFIRSYCTKGDNGRAQEDSLECPLTELGLVQSLEGGSSFQFRRGPKVTLPDAVFLYGLVCFWQSFFPTRRELGVETVTHDPGSPGRVFLLDEESVAERLSRLGALTSGLLSWDESSGMRQIYAADVGGTDPLSCVSELYGKQSERSRRAA